MIQKFSEELETIRIILDRNIVAVQSTIPRISGFAKTLSHQWHQTTKHCTWVNFSYEHTNYFFLKS